LKYWIQISHQSHFKECENENSSRGGESEIYVFTSHFLKSVKTRNHVVMERVNIYQLWTFYEVNMLYIWTC